MQHNAAATSYRQISVSGGQHRHFSNQQHGAPFEQPGELACFMRPRHLGLLDTMLVTVHSENRSGYVAMMHEEIEMSPGHLFVIMGVAGSSAHRSRVTGSPLSLNGYYSVD